MTNDKTHKRIQENIARCIEVQRLKALLAEEEKQIKAFLATEADADVENQLKTDGGGWSWSYTSTDGSVARVTQPAPSLKSKLDPEAKTFAKIKEAAGRCFMQLFMQVPAYKPVEGFREKAELHLDRAEARKLLKLVTTESAVTVSFEVKEGA